jgi:tryptophan synthase alpha chain
MNRLDATFRDCTLKGRAALMPYIVAGHPSLDETPRLIEALIAGGADIIELGVPFSDPIADGPVIRQAAHVALHNGTGLRLVLEMIAQLRRAGVTTPIVLMGYANPFLAYGLEALAQDAANLVDGFIVPDLSVEEADAWRPPLAGFGLHLIGFAAPTTTPHRLESIVHQSSGFLYCISVKGVTGRRAMIAESLPHDLARYREVTSLPLAVGFGLSTPDQVRTVSALADGVIVGSALVERIHDAPPGEAARAAAEFIATLAPATRRSPQFTREYAVSC